MPLWLFLACCYPFSKTPPCNLCLIDNFTGGNLFVLNTIWSTTLSCKVHYKANRKFGPLPFEETIAFYRIFFPRYRMFGPIALLVQMSYWSSRRRSNIGPRWAFVEVGMRYIQYMFVELNSFSLDNRSSKSVFAWCTLCAVPGWGVCGRMCVKITQVWVKIQRPLPS